MSDPTDVPAIEFPASARPRFEPDVNRTLVRNRRALRDAIRDIRSSYQQPAVVEQVVRGRKISVAVLGNDTIECMPLVELLPAGAKACPANLDSAVADRIRGVACAAYLAAGCRDYARIDLRLSRVGELAVIGVKWADLFARRGSFVSAAEAHDYTFATLMRRIVGEAARRYVISSRPHHDMPLSTPILSLPNRRAAAG